MSQAHHPAFSASKILLPLEFSDASEASIEAAIGLARQFHAAVHLVHVIPEFPNFNGSDFFPETAVLQERRELIEAKLSTCKQRFIHEGIHATSSIEVGDDIVGNLMLVIQREHIDMLVLSTHGLTGWRPVVLGSIAAQVIKLVSCSLLLLPPARPLQPKSTSAINTWGTTFGQPDHAGPAVPFIPDTPAEHRLDTAADALAAQGEVTEHKYDETHPLFTK